MTSTLRQPPVQLGSSTAAPPGRSRRATLAGAFLAAAVLALTAVAGIVPLLSPATPTSDAVTGFSLERAKDDLAVVAATPHPLGSPEQADVEAYLLQELTAMGLEPTVEAETVTMAPDPPNSVWTAPVRNIVARIEGTGPDADQAVLLAAHYDSVPTAAGAGDNGAGVVSVLAAMRALSAAPPPRHDVIAAFVDGEEHEMLGSLAIVESSEWLRDVRVALNTEGVGNAGRVIPALTSPSNGWALGQYLDAVPSPVVYSAFGAPLNATGQGADLGRYQDVVPAGLELVVIGGLPAYHAGTDTAAGMHEGSLAEYGGAVVRLAQQLSQADLDAVQEPDLAAFTLVSGITVAYPSTWSVPLGVLAALAVIGVIWFARSRGRVTLRRVVLAWLVLALAGLAGTLLATALWLAARLVDPRLSDALNGGTYERTAYVLAAVAAGLAGVLLVIWPLQRRGRPLEIVAGGLLGWAIFTVVLAVLLPDAAYAATWPLLAATVGFGVLAARERSEPATLATVTLAAIPAVLLIAPLVALYFILAARFELVGLPIATPLPMLWVVFALVLVVPLLLVAGGRRVGWRPTAVAGVVAVGLVAVGAVVSANSTGPRPDLLVYHADADAGTARWVAVPEELDAYTGQVADDGWTQTDFEASPFHEPGVTEAASVAPAPTLSADGLPAAEATVVEDLTTAEGRTISVEITPPPGSYAVTVDARSDDGIRGVSVNGKDVPEATSGAPTSVRIAAFSPSGTIPLEVTVPAAAEVELELSSYTAGLDSAPFDQLELRPETLTTATHEVPDAVLVTSVVQVP